ncbi:MAG: CBS domain-containing protein [Candidatus ainarchaeum sp.]|nr:CBS domain-containing protein [Candidatus ainarchaeum sp.]
MDYKNLVEKNIYFVEPDEQLSKIINKLRSEKVVFVKDKTKLYGAISKKSFMLLGTDLSKIKVKNIAKSVPELSKKTTPQAMVEAFVESNLEKLPYFENKDIIGYISRNKVLENIILPELNVTVEEVMSKNVVFINVNDNIAQVLALLKEHGIKKLVALDNGELAGVITITNIFNYFVSGDRINLDNLRNTKVKDVMKEDIISIGPSKHISDAIKKLTGGKTSSLVVHENKDIKGILTKTDILEKYLATQKKQNFSVQITSKLDKLPVDVVNKKVEQLSRFFRDDEETHIFVHLTLGNEKYKGSPLVHCRLRIVSPRNSENISVEGWGLDQAIELAIQKVKRRIVKERDTFY